MNLVNDPWMLVKYSDGTTKSISIRQAFNDAKDIVNIETPMFHERKVFIYDVPVIQLLAIITLAAYCKPENNFMATDPMFDLSESWDIEVINNYLDKWQDRFELFDDKYPFLQDIRLKSLAKIDSDLSEYLPKVSVVAPSGNNPVFEHTSNNPTSIENFRPTIEEIAYLTLYDGCLGICPMAANYPGLTLNGKTSFFVINVGDNLKETIIANCPSLKLSANEGMYDRPVWELDERTDIHKYDWAHIHENILLCSFFPSYPFYILFVDDEVRDIVLAKQNKKIKNECVLDSKVLSDLVDNSYIAINPWAIKRTAKDKDTKELKLSHKDWNPSERMLDLCVAATGKVLDYDACDILYKAGTCKKSRIYYRELDKYKTNVLSFGMYDVEECVFEKLNVPSNHSKAEKFKEVLNNINTEFWTFHKTVPTTRSGNKTTSLYIDNIKSVFNFYAEDYFFNTFIKNIDDENVVEKMANDLCTKAKLQAKTLSDVSINALEYADTYSKFCGKLNKIIKENTVNVED